MTRSEIWPIWGRMVPCGRPAFFRISSVFPFVFRQSASGSACRLLADLFAGSGGKRRKDAEKCGKSVLETRISLIPLNLNRAGSQEVTSSIPASSTNRINNLQKQSQGNMLQVADLEPQWSHFASLRAIPVLHPSPCKLPGPWQIQ